jgi:uncharacterized membrane protein YhhN
MRSLFFWLLLILHLLCILLQWNNGINITKCCLLLTLFFTYYLPSIKINIRPSPLILSALFSSFLGDVLLVFQTKNGSFFIYGLVAFLLAHTFYILFFVKHIKHNGELKLKILSILFLLMYATGLYLLLYAHLGAYKIPVLVYTLVISTMLFCVIHAFNKPTNTTAFWCISGAILFVLSDSILAINKFYSQFTAASFCIMLTYGLAQLFLIKGIFYMQKKHSI